MGKITDALQKAAAERGQRIEKISRIKERERTIIRKIGESKIHPNIVTYFDSKSPISEQFKILRTNILSMDKGKGPKTIGLTSSIHSEGKTVTAINLAISLAQSVHKPRILLIDADMRRGRMEHYLGTKHEKGLSNLLQGDSMPEDVLFHIDVDNLAFVGSGAVPENPAELLASDVMRRFLNDMKAQFDFVLIDLPPIIPVTDAGIIGPQIDGVMLVVQAGRTQRGIVKRAESLLYQSHTKILGNVLTNIEYHLPEYIYRYL